MRRAVCALTGGGGEYRQAFLAFCPPSSWLPGWLLARVCINFTLVFHLRVLTVLAFFLLFARFFKLMR